MKPHVHNRTLLLAAIRRELVGPDPVLTAKALDLQNPPIFKTFQEMLGPWTEAGSGQEILTQDNPTKRYGVGVLHPVPTDEKQGSDTTGQAAAETQQEKDLLEQESFASGEVADAPEGQPDPEGDAALRKKLEDMEEEVAKNAARVDPERGPEDAFDVSGANGFRPSAMAVSFLAEIHEDMILKVALPVILPEGHAFAGMSVNGRYHQARVKRHGKAKTKAPGEGAADQTVPAPEASAPLDTSAGPLGAAADEPTDATSADTPPTGEAQTVPAPQDGGQIVEDFIWVRAQVEAEYQVSAQDLLNAGGRFLRLKPTRSVGLEELNLSVELLARPVEVLGEGEAPRRLITVNLVNRSTGKGPGDGRSLFQTYFEVSLERDGQATPAILPYPKPPRHDPEEQSNALLYRNTPTFAAGHGSAADWVATSTERAHLVRVECLPVHETPSITPDITRKVGEGDAARLEAIDVPMRGLAGLDEGFDIAGNLQQICDAYAAWIQERRVELVSLPPQHQLTGETHLEACERALTRMQDGLAYLLGDPQALKAFKWANHAILLQQLRGDLPPRPAHYDEMHHRLTIRDQFPEVTDQPEGTRGRWRAFQIAFLLLAVESAANGEHPDRDVVELIWFPTGGGKTEAYLGLSAFSLFLRRLKNPNDVGVDVLMRYTLRLLTAQQFQRATGLICAMEYLRRRREQELGTAPYTAGIWVGDSTTRNTRKDALRDLNAIEQEKAAKNPFLITKCPWCGAQMGPFEHPVPLGTQTKVSGKRGKWGGKKAAEPKPDVPVTRTTALGYESRDGTVALRCSDGACDFQEELPIYVIDEDIYEYRPSLIIGTVDKFAMLAWKPVARSLFGLGLDGRREVSPPGLIIQDELHLIAGPLGSMAGLFEGVIEELCTDRRARKAIKPKLVCSTATIRSYREQVEALYARDRTELFPPPGLDVSDSFFSQYAFEKDGKTLQRGRMYVGVNGPGHGSMQTTQVRTFSALLQYPKALSPADQDPWWTLLTFFNALRELGTTVTLFQSDIPDYLKILEDRYALPKGTLRSPWNIKELTGRLDSEKVPLAIKELEVKTDNTEGDQPVDVCLASNIIEVGVDIGRLSLMAIVGQPKTTAQYIQVSGRVGRRWWERPGVVVMLYNASKPRDRSHFEKFRTYHEQLYAQVEPTSVTPFSPRALDRGLRAALVAFIRQQAEAGHDGPAATPKVFPEEWAQRFGNLILARVRQIDPEEEDNVRALLHQIRDEWKTLDKDSYFIPPPAGTGNPGLMTQAGQHVNPDVAELTWMTPQSMRNVDASCEAKITKLPEIDAMRRAQKKVFHDR